MASSDEPPGRKHHQEKYDDCSTLAARQWLPTRLTTTLIHARRPGSNDFSEPLRPTVVHHPPPFRFERRPISCGEMGRERSVHGVASIALPTCSGIAGMLVAEGSPKWKWPPAIDRYQVTRFL